MTASKLQRTFLCSNVWQLDVQAELESLIDSARLMALIPKLICISSSSALPVSRIDELLPWNIAPVLPIGSHIDSVR
ncbi:hypothetical protein PQR34_48100 [Paraburkholderia sediminicola]|jgi:transposase|uniref:hypothetical protein n=1 Tax=Paraburkholderia TaxID=1822464 RepID=UPI00117E6381